MVEEERIREGGGGGGGGREGREGGRQEATSGV